MLKTNLEKVENCSISVSCLKKYKFYGDLSEILLHVILYGYSSYI